MKEVFSHCTTLTSLLDDNPVTLGNISASSEGVLSSEVERIENELLEPVLDNNETSDVVIKSALPRPDSGTVINRDIEETIVHKTQEYGQYSRFAVNLRLYQNECKQKTVIF